MLRAVANHMFGSLLEPRFYILSGLVLFLVFSGFLTQGRFTMTYGRTERVITRQDHPRVYWGTETAIAILGALSLGSGIYFERRKRGL
jgi:formate hydrogenlyase subunit 3/multisubunit Na+/H+ antiporter MnhD subunit